MSEALTTTPVYASFWKRLYAYGYDSLLVLIATWLVGMQLPSPAAAQDITPEQLNATIQTLVAAGLLPEGTATYNLNDMMQYQLNNAFSWGDMLLPLAVSAIYNIAFLVGHWQATPGKRFCGIYVTNATGGKLTLTESILRHVTSGLSMLFFGLGYITIFFSRQKLAPHDMLCGTRVVMGKVNHV